MRATCRMHPARPRWSPGLLSLLAVGCLEGPAPSQTQPSTPSPGEAPVAGPPQPSGPPPGQGLSTLSEGEDLSGSWRAELAVEVQALAAPAGCVDADGDSFFDAWTCPGAPQATLDCDDQDPAVTPATELFIRPGPFLMGSASSRAGADEAPVHVVRLSGYCLDRVEVSAAELSAWLLAAGRKPAGADLRNLSAAGHVVPGRERHPAEGVTWEEARDYCAAQGKSLPTEAQWEKAARGGCELGSDPARCDAADLRPYPWGAAVPACTLANHQSTAGNVPRLCVSDTVHVDKLPEGAGPYGHLNLAGNVWEYVADWWHPRVYGGERSDPGGPAQGAAHVLRGGSWNTFSTNMRAANRFNDLIMGSATGMRCARSPVPAVPDAVEPLQMVTLSGVVRAESGTLSGRALYITVFDAADVNPQTQQLEPGQSPLVDVRLSPNGQEEQRFSVEVPATASVMVMAALDAGTGAQKEAYVSASGSGGFGSAEDNPFSAERARSGVNILLRRPPEGGPAAALGPGGPPPPGGPPAGAPAPAPSGPAFDPSRGFLPSMNPGSAPPAPGAPAPGAPPPAPGAGGKAP